LFLDLDLNAQDKDDWKLRIRGQPANPVMPGKWPLKMVYVSCTQ